MVSPYKCLLKEVANGLKEKDVTEIMFLLNFDAATEISSGTRLLAEMEKQDQLDEDNLDTLKSVLTQQNLKKLFKLVTKFEDSNKDKEEPLSKTWPTSGFPKRVTAETAHQIPQYQTTTMHGVAPPGSYHGNVQMAPPGNQYPMYQQPGVGHPMRNQLVPQMTHQVPLYQHGMGIPGNISMTTGGNSQSFPQQMPNEVEECQRIIRQLQDQQIINGQSLVQPTETDIPGSLLQGGAQQPPGHLSRLGSYPQTTKGYPPQDTPGHTKLSAVKSAPCVTSSMVQKPGKGSLGAEPVVGLKGAQPTHTHIQSMPMNIPPDNEDAVVKVQNTEKGNIMTTTASIGGLSSSNGIQGNGQDVAWGSDRTYQTGRVRVNSVENNESVAVATQPMTLKSMADAERLLLSGFTRMQLCEHHKVDSIGSGPYQVQIPEGSHYLTTEGAFVVTKFNSNYSIRLVNMNPQLRCSAVVIYNGKLAGDWALDPRSDITVEGPAYEEKKFHFVEVGRAPLGSGVKDDDPNNGLIQVTFTPELSTEPWNDLTRGFGNLGGEPETDYFGSDSSISTGQDVQRGFVRPPPADCWRAGATILEGRSDQQFTLSEDFRVDESGRKVITLRLVGK